MIEYEALRDAVECGMIDMQEISNQLKMKKEKEILNRHPRSVWQGKNGFWYTRIGKKLIKRKNKQDLDQTLIEHYKQEDEEVDPTFKKTYKDWIDSKRRYKEVNENTLLRYDDDYRRFIKDTPFECYKVSSIDDVILDDFIRSTIADFNLTAKAYSCLRTVILGTLKFAKRKRYTDFSVSTFFKDFQISNSAFQRPSGKKTIVYTKDERTILYNYLIDNPTTENLGLALICLTGLRIGELSALKLEDNVSDCHLYVHRTETRIKEDGKTKTVVHDIPKMGHEDTIVLPEAAQRIINLVKMRTHDDEYLFSRNGRRITSKVFRDHLKKACEKAGIAYKPPHQMRKTYASMLLAAKVDEAIIKKEMRHSNISTTRSYYQYITESDNGEKAIIDKVMGL